MNQDMFLSILRALVPAGTAYAVGRGWIGAGSAGEVTAAIVTLAAAGWGAFTHTASSKIAAVEALPAIKKIVVEAGTPRSDPAVEAAHDPDRPKVETEYMVASKAQRL